MSLPSWSDAADQDIQLKARAASPMDSDAVFDAVSPAGSLIVRLYGGGASRERRIEVAVADELARLGLSSHVIAELPGGVGRLEQTASAAQDPSDKPALAKALAQLHAVNVRAAVPKNVAALWPTLDGWLSAARAWLPSGAAGSRSLGRLVADAGSELPWLRRQLASPDNAERREMPTRVRELSNSPLAALDAHGRVALLLNGLATDYSDKVKFCSCHVVPQDGGAYNYRAFDLSAHLFGGEVDLPDLQQRDFLEAYVSASTPHLWADLRAGGHEGTFLSCLAIRAREYALAGHLGAVLRAAMLALQRDPLGRQTPKQAVERAAYFAEGRMRRYLELKEALKTRGFKAAMV